MSVSVWEFRQWLESLFPMWLALMPLVVLGVILVIKKVRHE